MASSAGAAAQSDENGGAAAKPAVDAGGREASGGLMAKANAALDSLDDNLPPSLRTKKMVAQHLGANTAARAACMAIISGEPLTRHQCRALFRLARNEKVADDVALSMMKLYHGEGVTPQELRQCEATAAKAGVPKAMITGLGWRAAENSSPGSMSVILEAQARIRGQKSAVDASNDDLVAVRVLRELVFERTPLPSDLVTYLTAILGAEKQHHEFLLRFARDVLAEPDSPLQIVVLRQLLLGHGCVRWSETKLSAEAQLALVEQLVEDIENGAPPKDHVPPSADEVATGAKLLQEALSDTHIDVAEAQRIYEHFDRDGSGVLDATEVEAVVFHLIREARDAMLAKEMDLDRQDEIKKGFKSVLRHCRTPEGTAEFMASFDPSGDGHVEQAEFLAHLPVFVDEMMRPNSSDGAPEPPSLVEAETFDSEAAVTPFDSELPRSEIAGNRKLADTVVSNKTKKTQQYSKDRKAEVNGELLDSDDFHQTREDAQDSTSSPRNQKGGLVAPKGFIEFFRYLAAPGGAAPRGLAATLYMCVEKRLPISVSLSVQHLLIGAELDSEDCANLLAFLSRGVQTENQMQLSSAVKEYLKLTVAAWAQADWNATIGDSTVESSDPTKSSSLKDTLRSMARGVSQINAADCKRLHALALQVLDGSHLYRGGPETIGRSGLESLLDGRWPQDSDAVSSSSTTVAANESLEPGLADVRFVNPLDMMEDEDDDIEEDGGTATDEPRFIVSDNSAELDGDRSPMSPSAMQKYAEEFEPDYMESADHSLVKLLGFQTLDPFTVSAFQTLVSRRALNEQEMHALHTMAAASGTDSDIIDTLVWLWNGGDAANDDVLREMIVPPQWAGERGPPQVEQPEKGTLQLTCVKATGLINKDQFSKSDPFALVRVEGHGRITQTVAKNLNPEWEADDQDAATFMFRVVNRNTAVVEVYLYDEDQGDQADELGCVTFPLSVLDAGIEVEQEFIIEPTRTMPQQRGDASLGKLTLRMMFEKSDTQFEIPQMETSQAVEALLAAMTERKMNHDVQMLLREAAAIVIARTKDDLATTPLGSNENTTSEKTNFEGMSRKEKKAAKKALKQKQKEALENLPKGLQITGKLDPHKPTLEELQEQSKVKKTETKEVFGKRVALIDIAYDEDTDKDMEAALLRPMRAKYLTAISFALSKFLSFNPAILNVVDDTITKFEPAPEVTGHFAAALLGTVGIDETPQKKELILVKRFLADRLNEEVEKLVRSSKTNKAWFTQLQKMCRGEGCSIASVDHASEIVAEADSFSTAGALYRVARGLGAAEPDELAELDRLVEANDSEDADFITAGVQNLQRMIWPKREATFEMVRELLAGSELAERGLAGWENRAELRLMLRGDERALQALDGLVQMEEFRAYLKLKAKELELIALDKVMAGDKAAEAVLYRLTPTFGQMLSQEWEEASLFTKVKLIFIAVSAVVMMLSKLLKALLDETPAADAIAYVLDIIFFICAMFGGLLLGAYFILKGKPYRDNVIGPDSTGVALLQKVANAEMDPHLNAKASRSLQLLLMGQEPDAEGLTYLQQVAAKFHEKVPEAQQALDCMENILILQAAGKETAKIAEYDAKVEWPTKDEVCPPSRMKCSEALSRVKEKAMRFFFKTSIHPWMKKYAKCADDIDKLYEDVEVPLSMMQNNAEEFDALDKLHKGYRPDPAGLMPLVTLVDELNNIDSNGPHASTLQQAMQENCRTGRVKEVFAKLDEDGSGYLSNHEFELAAEQLSLDLGFKVNDDELDKAFEDMDTSGDDQVELAEFEVWWKSVCLSKKELKLLKQEQMVDAGLLEESPGVKQLKAQLKIITKLAPTVGMSTRCFQTLEDMCADDATFDLLQECFHLCELKRVLMNDTVAFKAVVGLEAVCMVPLLLQGNEKLGISANPKAMQVLKDVTNGDKGAIAALEYLSQPEWRRYWGMLTQRMRRLVFCIGGAIGYPILVATGIVDPPSATSFDSLVGDLAGLAMAGSSSGSWAHDDSGEALNTTFGAANATSPAMGDYTNPSFYVLGLIPLVTSLFVNLFGQRIASVITLISVFIGAAAATISAALNDGTDEITPAKFIGVCSGLFAGGTALKVASGNVKFAYAVQGASIGAVASRATLGIWRPRLLWLIPELQLYMDWVDMSVGIAFGAAAAWASNAYRNIISIFATAVIGTLGLVQTMTAYGIPGMENWTLARLTQGGIQCTDDSCWGAGIVVLASAWAGTVNQFKMESMDFSMPAVTAYERLLASVDKAMALLFAINEFINKADNLDTGELMEQCLAARDKMAQYAGVFDAVQWVGVASLAMAIVTPVMATIGTLAATFTQPQLLNRLVEVKVPPIVRKIFPGLVPHGHETIVIKFGPIGRYLQNLSFYLGMANGFISMLIVGVSWLTAEMYRIKVRAEWDTLSLSMPGLSLEAAMDRVVGSVSSIGDSAAGLVSILGASIVATAYDLGGTSWLLVHVVEMEQYFILGAGAIISGVAFKLGSDYPAGMLMFGPLGLLGGVTTFFGTLHAVPWFEKKFPDLMYTLHKFQLVICAALGVMFVVMVSYSRSAQEFIDQNWNGCQYQTLCELIGEGDWSMQEYAATLNVDRIGMEGILRPMLQASSALCLSCLAMLAGGSNLAKHAYYLTIVSRREEIAAAKAEGKDGGGVRRDALARKIRGQRQADIKAAALAMERAKITDLEETALIMEFATGVSMEQHYDLTMHDEIMAEIEKTSAVEARATAAMGNASFPSSMGISSSTAATSPLEVSQIGMTNPASGAAPPPSDDLDLAKAKRALEGGLSVDAAKQKLGALADSAAETASDFAATTTEKLGSRHQTMQNTGLSMGVKDTGSSLATLARALANDGVRSDFHDMRKDEKIPLKSRIKGAKELFAKTREQNTAGWSSLDIHSKRTRTYAQMKQEVENGSMLPSVALSNLFEKRV